LDQRTGQYHYHTYLEQQPDLNRRNPQVRRAMLEVLRFWLRRGVDGFRIDALRHLIRQSTDATTRQTTGIAPQSLAVDGDRASASPVRRAQPVDQPGADGGIHRVAVHPCKHPALTASTLARVCRSPPPVTRVGDPRQPFQQARAFAQGKRAGMLEIGDGGGDEG
jgi:hypothetical protein